MAEMEIPNTGNPAVDAALDRIRGRFADLEAAMVVSAFLEKKAGERIKEHAELLVRHDEWLVRHQEAVEQHNLQMREFDEKLNLLIDREMRREGGPESAR